VKEMNVSEQLRQSEAVDDAVPVVKTRRALIFPRWFQILLVLSVLAMGAYHVSVPNDRAMANVWVMMLGVVLAFILYVRFVIFSPVSGWLRLGVLMGLPVLVFAGGSQLEIVGVSGLLIPTIQLRGTKMADENLQQVAAVVEQGVVDLSQSDRRVDYPRFLGPDGHPHVTNAVWNADPDSTNVHLQWRHEIGAGWSSFAAVHGFAVTTEQRGEEEIVSCYELAGGVLRWAHAVKQRHATVLGGIGPRATPAIASGRVYSVGATGHFVCLEGATGDVLWEKELLDIIQSTAEEELGVIAWGRSPSPLIVDDLVVIPLGGPPGGPFHSLIAFDQESGEERWRSGTVQIGYASPTVMTLASVRQIVSVNESTVSGHDIPTGNVLWEHPWPGSSTAGANNSQAVAVGNDRIVVSKGYGFGSSLFTVVKKDDVWTTNEVWKNPRVLKTKYTNIVVVDDLAYGLSDGILECVQISTGDRLWKKGRFNHGQIMMIDDIIVVQDEDGPLHFIRPHATGYDSLLTVAAMEGTSWANPALFDNKLIVRNATTIACYELPISRN